MSGTRTYRKLEPVTSMGKSRLHICHLTVLNPAVHSRIFFKEALAQVEAGYKVTIIGQDPAKEPYKRNGVRIIPTGVFHRRGPKRLSAPRKIYKKALKTGADLFQIHTPELLKVGKALKKEMKGVKLIYDVHEDYASNIRNGTSYPAWTKSGLTKRVRKIENNFHSYGDGLIYAEDCYAGMLKMSDKRTAFVRNKFAKPKNIDYEANSGRRPYMLYCGTISNAWGLSRSLELWNLLKEMEPIDFIIAGHTHDRELIDEIQDWTGEDGDEGSVRLMGGLNYLPYEEIVTLINGCLFGTALYDPAPHIKDKVPTKFYEFMGMEKPLVFTNNPRWKKLNEQFDLGISVSYPFKSHKLERIYHELIQQRKPFFERNMTEADWSWDYEKKALLKMVKKVLGE